MKRLIERFASHVKGCITGFDRIVFKGLMGRLEIMWASSSTVCLPEN